MTAQCPIPSAGEVAGSDTSLFGSERVSPCSLKVGGGGGFLGKEDPVPPDLWICGWREHGLGGGRPLFLAPL